MKLKATKVDLRYSDMFTVGCVYEIEKISPNGKMALVKDDAGDHVHVSVENSVYALFEILE